MSVLAKCSCGKKFQVPADLVGKKFRCPGCSEAVAIQERSDANEMQIPVVCECGKAFHARANLAGQTVGCPTCGQPIHIPVSRSSSVATRPPQSAGSVPDGGASVAGMQPTKVSFPSTLNTPVQSWPTQPSRPRHSVNLGPLIKLGIWLCVVLAIGGIGYILFVSMGPLISEIAKRGQPLTPDNLRWRRVKSEEGGFSIEMPFAHYTSKEVTPLGAAGTLNSTLFSCDHPAATAVAGFAPFPKGHPMDDLFQENPEAFLQAEAWAAEKDGFTKVLSSRQMVVAGFPGIEFKARDDSEPRSRTKTKRICLTSTHVYALEWIATEGEPPSNAERFFNSFELLNAK